MANLLILEPDERLNQNMCRILERVGHHCTGVTSVSAGEFCLEHGQRCATILNTRLRWTESRAFLSHLEDRGLPVLFLVADAASEGHLRAMYRHDCGVLQAPFTGLALVNAVNALLSAEGSTLSHGSLRMDVAKHRVTQNGRELSLTAQEFELLRALMQQPNMPLTRERLLRDAWGYQSIGVTRTVDVHIQRLRRKIGAAQIETVYKTGYRLR